MKYRKLPPFVLAVFLQFSPVVKLFRANPLMIASSPLAIVLRWVVGVAAAVGAYHTVTGASAAIVGMQKLTNSPSGPKGAGPLTNNAVEPAGGPFFYRIIVTNHGTDTNQDFWNVIPLPPGITIDTTAAGRGWITDDPANPTVVGVYPVTLVAGNSNYPTVVTFPATITITGSGPSPPTITAPPTSLAVTEGQNAAFSVTASGTPPLTYQWQFNGTNLTGQTSSNLSLLSVTLSQGGPYSVVVSNDTGSVTNDPPAVLTVNSAAGIPVITNQPASTTVLSGSNASFTVGASGAPPLSYQWKKGTSPINGANSATLTVTNAQLSNAGSYSVLVINSAGTNVSNSATLTVVDRPLLTVSASQGNQVTLSFTSQATVSYALEYVSSLPSAWVTLTNFPAIPTLADRSVVDSTTGGEMRFYRLNLSLP